MPLQEGCRCSVLWFGGRATNFAGVDVVPLLGALQAAIVVCYGGGRGE